MAQLARERAGQEDATTGLYGKWQTELYKAPPVVDGMIPRNRFNNIYLFRPTMLPAGCVHIPYPGVVTLAMKRNLEAVSAMVGWQSKGGRSFPELRGAVVLQENAAELTAAILEQRRVKAERDALRRKKRVRKAWLTLAKVLSERHKVKAKIKEEQKMKQIQRA